MIYNTCLVNIDEEMNLDFDRGQFHFLNFDRGQFNHPNFDRGQFHYPDCEMIQTTTYYI